LDDLKDPSLARTDIGHGFGDFKLCGWDFLRSEGVRLEPTQVRDNAN